MAKDQNRKRDSNSKASPMTPPKRGDKTPKMVHSPAGMKGKTKETKEKETVDDMMKIDGVITNKKEEDELMERQGKEEVAKDLVDLFERMKTGQPLPPLACLAAGNSQVSQ